MVPREGAALTKTALRERRWPIHAVRILLVLLTGGAAWLLARNGGEWLRQIGRFTWEFDWPLLALSSLLLGISYRFIPSGWNLLARRAGSDASDRELRGVWFVSQLGRYVPGKVWLFAGRAAFLKSRGLTGYRASSVPFLELVYMAAAAGLSALIPLLLSGGEIFESAALKGAVVAAGLSILLIPFLRPLQRRLYRLRHGNVPDRLPLPGPADSFRLLLLYSVIWWMRGLTLYLWLKGFGLHDVSVWACFAAAPLSWLAGYIVFLVPGGLGVREAAVTALVASAGQTGPVLAVIAGQRLILSVIELSFALTAAGRRGILRKGRKT